MMARLRGWRGMVVLHGAEGHDGCKRGSGRLRGPGVLGDATVVRAAMTIWCRADSRVAELSLTTDVAQNGRVHG